MAENGAESVGVSAEASKALGFGAGTLGWPGLIGQTVTYSPGQYWTCSCCGHVTNAGPTGSVTTITPGEAAADADPEQKQADAA